jgi:gamma-glutamylcyclotransferase (GGCT)/AIG2-like uncharacterized protein YtfP
MEIDNIIEGLNKKRKALGSGLVNLEDKDLTEAEKAFIKTYSPEKALIIYGTLAPGRPNHSVVEHIKGKWQQGIVRGKLEKEGWGAELGYYGFRHTGIEEQEEIKAYVLFSDELVANWPSLDEFEGDGYRRLLAKFELENGVTGIGNIYAINEEKV